MRRPIESSTKRMLDDVRAMLDEAKDALEEDATRASVFDVKVV